MNKEKIVLEIPFSMTVVVFRDRVVEAAREYQSDEARAAGDEPPQPAMEKAVEDLRKEMAADARKAIFDALAAYYAHSGADSNLVMQIVTGVSPDTLSQAMRSLRYDPRVLHLEQVMEDFRGFGTRTDLHPTKMIPRSDVGWDASEAFRNESWWHEYIKRMDKHVCEKAKAALECAKKLKEENQ